MRGNSRRRNVEDEEESAFVSMTDLTVSFLFIIMILLAYSASRMSSEESVPRPQYEELRVERDSLQIERDALLQAKEQLEAQLKKALLLADDQARTIDELQRRIAELQKRLEEQDPLEVYISQVSSLREMILRRLETQLKQDFPDLEVVVNAQSDALQFMGDGLFESGRSNLSPGKAEIVERIAARLNEILPCYTFGPESRWLPECNEVGAVIEAVQLEGHTDITGGEDNNIRLSTARANETFFVMKGHEPTLTRHLNWRNQPVMSVAGYGAMRPIVDNATPGGRATNRRIDLRIIMYTPTGTDEIDDIVARLRGETGNAVTE